MNRETFNACFTALVRAYAYVGEKADVQTQDVYWEMLKDIPDETFNQGVRKCLAESKFFPTIAELGEASLPTIRKLSDYYVHTDNGRDRKWIEINWQKQLEALRVPIDSRVEGLLKGIGA